MSSKLLECWWTASFRAMYISFCSVLKLTNDFEITDWNYIQVLRGKYPIRVRKIVYVIHRLCWINLISETNLASNMLLYKGCEFFVENTPQVHSSMKASFLFDRFTNISKSKVSSIFPCKSPESLKNIEVSSSNWIIVVYVPLHNVIMKRCTLWFEICILKDIDTDLVTIFYLC